MKKFWTIGLLSALTVFNSCSNNENIAQENDFEKVEQLLNMKKPFSQDQKNKLIVKYGSAENFYNEVIKRKLFIADTKIKKTQSKLTPYAFKVKLIMPDGEHTIDCDESTYIYDQANEDGIDLPICDRAGSSSSCVAKLVSGDVDNTLNNFLTDGQLDLGYRLLCVGYALSDCTLETHQEDTLPDV
ncbi:2Fe-2S iron-sulfur cluster-binding protein [Chryseobacterium sp. C39-AII1]|uniref:2Fe-2S iron-sulfur cluster-binding protein n=1 Tax=Chryseobacterium sp. C39-AII1 TaxID=3080332 RepID=UPI003208C636